MTGVGKTNIGMVRSKNEDSIFISNSPVGILPNLYIVADGMGGHNAGEVASSRAIEFFLEYIKNNNSEESILDIMVSAISYANENIYELSLENEEFSEMGTTFLSCVIFDNKLYIAHIGDSRLYLIYDNEIKQITTDHTYVMEMVKAGTITKDEAKNHPKRSMLLRALGVENSINADGLVINIKDTDKILLCSDGLTNMLEDDFIKDLLKSDLQTDIKVDTLIEKANELGGLDNISVIVIEQVRREN